MVLKNRTNPKPERTFLQRRNGEAALTRDRLVTHYLKLVSSDGCWLDQLSPPERKVVADGDTRLTPVTALYSEALAQEVLIILTNHLDSLALQFNPGAPSDLFVTVTAPAHVVENVSFSARTPISYFRARLSSRSQSLVLRASKDLLEIFLMPVEYTLGLSKEEAKQTPLKQLRVSGNSLVFKLTCADSGSTISSDSIGPLCKELFSALIKGPAEQNDPVPCIEATVVPINQLESQQIDELSSSDDEVIMETSPLLCPRELTEPESFLNKLHAIANARYQTAFPFDVTFCAAEQHFHKKSEGISQLTSELTHRGPFEILPIKQSSSTPIEFSFVPTDRIMWRAENQIVDIAVLPSQFDTLLRTELQEMITDPTFDHNAIRRFASTHSLLPFNVEQLRAHFLNQQVKNRFEQVRCLEKLTGLLRQCELLFGEASSLEQNLLRYLALTADGQAIESDVTKLARRGEVCFSI